MVSQASSPDNILGITPGSLAGLKVEALADAREYTALAALAQTANDMGALKALAAAAGESEAAFRWMWTIASAGPQPQRWEQIRRDLVEGIRVPENLQDAVTQFVLTPVPEQAQQAQQVRQQPQRQQPPDPRREVQTLLLEKMDAKTPFVRDLARSVLEQELGRLPQGVRQAAFGVLGTSGVAADRKLVFEHAEELLPRDRLGPLAALSVPYSDAEVQQITNVLGEALPIGQSPARSYPGEPPPQTYWEQARKLAARLPAEDILELLQEPWTRTSAQRANLLDSALVQDMGLEKFKVLLASDLDEPVLKQLLEVSSQALPLEELAELGRFSHRHLPPPLSRPLRSRLSTYARNKRGRGPRSEVGEQALVALRDFTLLCDDPAVAEDYAKCLEPGEFVTAARRVDGVDSPPRSSSVRRLGRVAGVLLARGKDAFDDYDFKTDISDAAKALSNDSSKAEFLSAFVEIPSKLEESEDPLPDLDVPDVAFLVPDVLGYSASIGVLAEAGHGHAVVDAAKRADVPVRECLIIAEAAIRDLHDATLEGLREELYWSALDLGDYERYVAALSQRPEVLYQETEKALDSLSGPEVDVIAQGKLALLLRAALDAGTDTEDGAEDLGVVTDRVTDRSTEHLQRLFGTASRPLHDLAREWAEQLTPDEDLVRLVVQTAKTTVGAEEEFGRVRRTLAAKLVDETHSPANDWGSRGGCLELAREADPEVARQAALALGGAGPTDFRQRAAKVLADTDAREADEEALRRLAEDETDARVRKQLTAALSNITSGSVGRAVQNLRSLVGRDPDEGPDVDVLLPDEDWHETFVAHVDKARQQAGGDPDAYISSLVKLTDLMVEQAVIARFEAEPENGSVKKHEVEALRRNHSKKPGIGALLERQRGQSVFPWFNEAIVLRRLRNAHPSPTGSTRPLLLGDDEVVEANALFRRIVLGWETSMQDSA